MRPVLAFLTSAFAGFQEQMDVIHKLGYAKAAVEVCPKLKINPKGILALLSNLDASDQASIAADSAVSDFAKDEARKMFDMLGPDGARQAARDYQQKLGIELFSDR
jgi:hypothetical protein